MTKRKARIYFARVNLSGLYDSKPVTLFYRDDDYYWSRDGNIFVNLEDKRRLTPKYGCIDFWSEDKNEVKLWLKGATAVMYMLNSWSKVNKE